MEKSQWQLASSSRFDDGGRREAIERQRARDEAVSSRAPAVPSGRALYDPTHPDADTRASCRASAPARPLRRAGGPRVQLAPRPTGRPSRRRRPTRDYGAEASRGATGDRARRSTARRRREPGRGATRGPHRRRRPLRAGELPERRGCAGRRRRTRAEQLADHRRPRARCASCRSTSSRSRRTCDAAAAGPPGARPAGARARARARRHSAPRAGDPGGCRSQSALSGGSMLASIGKAVAQRPGERVPGARAAAWARRDAQENFQPATAIPGYTGRRRV